MVKVISLPYIFQVLYVLCFTRPRYQVSVYRTIGPLVIVLLQHFHNNVCIAFGISYSELVTHQPLIQAADKPLSHWVQAVLHTATES